MAICTASSVNVWASNPSGWLKNQTCSMAVSSEICVDPGGHIPLILMAGGAGRDHAATLVGVPLESRLLVNIADMGDVHDPGEDHPSVRSLDVDKILRVG